MIRLHLNIGTLKIGQVRTMRRWNYEESNFWSGKSVWWKSDSHVGFDSKMQFWSRLLLRIWTKIAHSNLLKVDQNCILTRDHGRRGIDSFSLQSSRFDPNRATNCNFDPFSNCSNAQFWSRFEVKPWTKIVSAKQIQYVIMNSFWHF